MRRPASAARKTAVVVPAALDSNGQELNGGTGPRPLASRRTLAQPPAACSFSPHTSLHWRWLALDGRTAPWYCGRWDCPSCADLLASRWADIITVAAPQRHIVLTRLGPAPQLARSQLRNIVKAARRGQFNGTGSRSSHQPFEYFASMETHACGYVHAHLLQRGASIPKRRLSAALPAYGAGAVCWLRSISEAHRPAAVARYVARHLIGTQHADQIKQGRRIRYSRNFWGGCTTAQVAAALWPRDPDPVPWTLIGPCPRFESPSGPIGRPHFRTRLPPPLDSWSPEMQALQRTADALAAAAQN